MNEYMYFSGHMKKPQIQMSQKILKKKGKKKVKMFLVECPYLDNLITVNISVPTPLPT